ncbi:hypothetical protein BDV38DRAFT_156204 [Aspergillus pseudotamarii]|uniref:Uncharacterized protein n=1 Tax=Aspergillus pseudotamarii TaxID=132259 RepID=A0A5N6SIY2_ASPPS|nr:uncharacterized protein BDV38DRAFT_156204 [Aspergillus pseudotamarii]KAE8134646.1 hypothetical protein BDV38DRAFT_156204 [Aspergillus pseudotamarii]
MHMALRWICRLVDLSASSLPSPVLGIQLEVEIVPDTFPFPGSADRLPCLIGIFHITMQLLSPCIVISPESLHFIEFICLDTDGSIIAAPCHDWPSRGCMMQASVMVYMCLPSTISRSDNERFPAKSGRSPP